VTVRNAEHKGLCFESHVVALERVRGHLPAARATVAAEALVPELPARWHPIHVQRSELTELMAAMARSIGAREQTSGEAPHRCDGSGDPPMTKTILFWFWEDAIRSYFAKPDERLRVERRAPPGYRSRQAIAR
jgi:hypothetical protein